MTPRVPTASDPPRRRPLVAVFFSGLFPGLGQFYNRQRGKAAVFVIAAVLTGFGPLSPLDVNIDFADIAGGLRRAMLASLPFFAVAVWSVIDAYRVARRS